MVLSFDFFGISVILVTKLSDFFVPYSLSRCNLWLSSEFMHSDDDSKSKKGAAKSRDGAESDTLSDIDVATPLRPDEIIPKSKAHASQRAEDKNSSKPKHSDSHRSSRSKHSKTDASGKSESEVLSESRKHREVRVKCRSTILA